ncbi:MAG: NYN domain-containing protein, partial [Anaerolineae bacterium]
MVNSSSFSRVGVYVDASNIYRNGGNRMRYDVLREFAVRDGAELMRLNAYVSYDAERARIDSTYDTSVNKFFSVIRDLGYKVIIKEVKWYEDEEGARYGKANADLDLAVDMLLQSEKLERVVLVSGDGDFTRVVRVV